MKQRLALGLSIVGVLSAGSAAALVNTQILSARAESSTGVPTATASSPIVLTVDPQTGAVTPSPSSTTPEAPRSDAGATLPSVDDGTESVQTSPTTQVPTSTSPANASTTSTTTTVAPSATSVSYQVGSAGTVVLETRGDVLRVVSVVPEPGWEVVEAVQESPTEVEITFRSATTRVEFEANLAFGVVMPSVESYHLSPVTSTPGTGTVPYEDHDDDDEDDDGDDDYDDGDDYDDDDYDDD